MSASTDLDAMTFLGDSMVWSPWLRVGAFLAVLSLMSLLEAAFPRRTRRISRWRRWSTNLSLVVCGAIVVRLAAPLGGVAAALWAGSNSVGLFHNLAWPDALRWIVALAVLDLAVFAQHVAFHHLPWLWRLHLVHHADPELDASSGVRFHPLELLISALWRALVVLALGASAEQVLVFELLLNGMAVFNHASVRLPAILDSSLRLLIVTPDMHRIHHSTDPHEYQQNFGFSLSIWDRLFRSYCAEPKLGQVEMVIGLPQLDPIRSTSLPACLVLPFTI